MTMQKTTIKTVYKKNIKCPYCGGKTANYDKELVCINCSSVIEPNSIKNKKTSSKMLNDHLMQPGLQINHETSVHNMDFGEESSKYWQKLLHTSDNSERNMASTLLEITKIGQNMCAPESVSKIALEFYRTIINNNLTKRIPKKVLAATILYVGFKESGVPMSINQAGYLSKITPAKIRNEYNTLFKKMKKTSKPSISDRYVSKIAINVFKQEKTIEVAEKIIYALHDQRFVQGKNPVGIAASVCYLASILSGERKTQREIAEVARVTEATLRTRYKQISKKLNFRFSL